MSSFTARKDKNKGKTAPRTIISFESLSFRTPQFKLMNKLLGKKTVLSAFDYALLWEMEMKDASALQIKEKMRRGKGCT